MTDRDVAAVTAGPLSLVLIFVSLDAALLLLAAALSVLHGEWGLAGVLAAAGVSAFVAGCMDDYADCLVRWTRRSGR